MLTCRLTRNTEESLTMTLRATTSILLHAPDAARQIKLADSYMQAFNRLPDQFVLPKTHEVLLPLIEAFAHDTAAFAKYIKVLRDAALKSGDQNGYRELHAAYRTVSIRALQAERRSRIRKAAVMLVPALEGRLGRTLPYKEQTKVADFIEQRWGAMRIEAADAERAMLSAGRLNAETRNIVYDQFWYEISQQLEKGVVPLGGDEHFEALVSELLDSV